VWRRNALDPPTARSPSSDHEIEPHPNGAAFALHHPDQMRRACSHRHTVGQHHHAGVGLEFRLEDQRPRPVAATGRRVGRSPPAISSHAGCHLARYRPGLWGAAPAGPGGIRIRLPLEAEHRWRERKSSSACAGRQSCPRPTTGSSSAASAARRCSSRMSSSPAPSTWLAFTKGKPAQSGDPDPPVAGSRRTDQPLARGGRRDVPERALSAPHSLASTRLRADAPDFSSSALHAPASRGKRSSSGRSIPVHRVCLHGGGSTWWYTPIAYSTDS
jgi:hypothetical protein